MIRVASLTGNDKVVYEQTVARSKIAIREKKISSAAAKEARNVAAAALIASLGNVI